MDKMVAGLIPGLTPWCGFNPWLMRIPEGTQLMFLSHSDVFSLSRPLPLSLKSNEKMSLGEGQKQTTIFHTLVGLNKTIFVTHSAQFVYKQW